ncbi:serine-rich adhesin for platelets-like [Tribolium madens]|uniref:serine-rich adhesin for platelets-like n=1 Tax=Tribolium madens TaxID=41895 RepID=UPI001CF72E47|nr:serine-rich adhesin for platelets-like [Tribolium madens]
MKTVPQRKPNMSLGVLQQSTKMPEVTVIKHFQPNPARETKGHIPEVKCSEHLPEGSRYLHLHPVFKFVDNFLSSSAENNKTRAYVNGKSCVKFNNKSTCCPTYAVSNSYVKNLATKKSRMPACLSQKQDRIKTNLCNMSSSSNIRVSLRPPRCTPCVHGIAPSPSSRETETKLQKPCVDFYIEELKSEIKQNKPKIQELDINNDDYVKKLKEELMVQKSRCLDDARNIINDLQKEIYNYRLQVKARFASSSDTLGGDKTPTKIRPASPQRKQIGDKVIFESLHSPDGTIGSKPCETLWRSKASFASSTDLDSGQGAPDINFEEKLQEANVLIDKVRNALRDIGKGIHKVPEQKKVQSLRDAKLSGRELIYVVPKPSEDKKKVTKEIKKIEQKKQEPAVPESVVRKLVEEAKMKAIEEERKKIIEEKKKRIAPEPKKNDSLVVVKKPAEVKKGEVRKPELMRKEEPASPRQVFIPRPTLVTDHYENLSVQTDVSQSMEILQSKLNAITEISETDLTSKTEARKTEPKFPVSTTERASSPINLKQPKKHLDSDVSAESAAGSSTSDVGRFLSIVLERQSQNSSLAVEKTPTTSKSKSPMRNTSSEKTSKLSIHVMPPVDIPKSLVMQRVLSLSIKPTGSVTNHIAKKGRNVGYEEVKVHLCPADCRLPDGSCKLAHATTRDDTQEDLVSCSQFCKNAPSTTKEELASCSHPLQGIYEPNLYRRQAPSGHILSKESDIINPTASILSKSRRPSGLTEDALILFRSFQILDEAPKDSQLSLSTITRKRARSISETDRKYDRPERIPVSAKCCSSREVVKPDKELPHHYIHERSPWDFGFYQTKSTQCSRTSLPKDMSQKPSDSDDMPKSSSFEFSPRSPTSQRSSLEEEPEEHEGIRTPSEESVALPKRAIRSTIDLSERNGVRKSQESASASVSASVHPLEPPVKDQQDGPAYNMSDILNLLNEQQAQDVTSISQSIASPAEQEPHKRKRSSSSREIKNSDSSSSSSTSGEQKKDKKKDTKRNSASSSSSSSSYSNAGSPPRISPMNLITSPSGLIRSREASTTRSKESSVHTVKSINEAKVSVLVSKPEIDDKKLSDKLPTLETDSFKDTKSQSSSGKTGRKTDKNIQVSLSPEESSSSSSEEEPKEDSSTVACFIRGLTGTSEEQLNKLKSTASFPKSDPSTWSAVKLPTMKEELNKEISDLSLLEETKEKVVGSTEYTDSPENPGNPSTVSTLSEVTKMKRLQHFQKMAQDALHLEKKSNEKDVFMSLVQPKGEAGEGMDRTLRTGRNLPFYRRVLGRILEPSRKMQTSQSDPTANPLDESISEGEIKCRSASIGEIRPVRYALDRKKLSKGVMRYTRKYDDLGDKPWRIARQRTQYNQWVSYYLQKHHNVSFNDSTSTSLVSSKK